MEDLDEAKDLGIPLWIIRPMMCRAVWIAKTPKVLVVVDDCIDKAL
jgi:hypothetical protein